VSLADGTAVVGLRAGEVFRLCYVLYASGHHPIAGASASIRAALAVCRKAKLHMEIFHILAR
jgi:hypothetical protein